MENFSRSSIRSKKRTSTKDQRPFAKITETYPQLDTTVKWNQPMFTDHGTFIIAFSFAKIIFYRTGKAAIRALEKYPRSRLRIYG